jgi:hypothetical protein
MRALSLVFLAVAVLSMPALAGEEKLGDLVSAAGGDITNASTATPFVIPIGSKLTLNCTAAANVCTDTSTACATSGAGQGLPISASSNFPTSVRPQPSSAPTVTISGKLSSILRIAGAAAVTCSVWMRTGNE